MEREIDPEGITFGTEVFTEDGRKLGTIRGFDEDGCYISFREGLEALSHRHVHTDPRFGEAELMWRCWECGEMGQIDQELPEACPSCGAKREDLYYWTED